MNIHCTRSKWSRCSRRNKNVNWVGSRKSSAGIRRTESSFIANPNLMKRQIIGSNEEPASTRNRSHMHIKALLLYVIECGFHSVLKHRQQWGKSHHWCPMSALTCKPHADCHLVPHRDLKWFQLTCRKSNTDNSSSTLLKDWRRTIFGISNPYWPPACLLSADNALSPPQKQSNPREKRKTNTGNELINKQTDREADKTSKTKPLRQRQERKCECGKLLTQEHFARMEKAKSARKEAAKSQKQENQEL